MKLLKLQRVLSVGLAIKVLALLLAILFTGPQFTAGPEKVAAQTAKAAPSAAQPPTVPTLPPEAFDGQPRSYDPRLIKLMDDRQKEIAREEERLARERQELEKLKKEVAGRIAELKKVQAVLEELVATEKGQRQARILKLVKVLSNMRPDAAAKVITKLDDQMSVEIFSRMGARQAGKVMAALDPRKAARISVLLTRQQEADKAAKVAAEAARQGAQPPPKKQ